MEKGKKNCANRNYNGIFLAALKKMSALLGRNGAVIKKYKIV